MVMFLSKFDFNFVTQTTIKGQSIVDQLVEAPSPKSIPTLELFPDENLFTMNH